MDSDGSEGYENSDNEIDEKVHAKLIKNVLNLTNKQHVKKPSRTEPTINISEYDLVKSGKNIQISDLANVLKKRGNQFELGKKIRNAELKSKTLPKPLEKPKADRIRRTVAFNSAKSKLDRWDPIVTSLRAASHLKFPMNTDVNLIKEDLVSGWRLKSDLQKKLEEIKPAVEVFNVEEEQKIPLTMQEILEKRKEAAKLRAHESYKVAKARRQNKIKSKKYHRIQKREKVKQQFKEFELLQKSNPEAALLKLEEIEKARAEERVSLRHKSTGQWAKNKLIRAKYDKDSRQILAQQLAISRDLTQKVKAGNESDSEGEANNVAVATVVANDPNNPWINGNHIKISKEVSDFVSGYRKYWEKKNNIKNGEENSTKKSAEDEENENSEDDSGNIKFNSTKSKSKSRNVTNDFKAEIKSNKFEEETTEDLKISNKKQKLQESNKEEKLQENNRNKKLQESKTVKKITKNITKAKALSTSDWEVTDLSIEKEFNKLDNKLRKKIEQKYKKLASEMIPNEKVSKTRKRKKQPKSQKTPDLSLPKQLKRPIIDEELNEKTGNSNESSESEIKKMKIILNKKDINKAPKEIDPNKFINVKQTQLNSEIPNLLSFDDNEETDQKGVISEAFQDDDIIEDFQKDKQNDINKNMPENVDLTLPGWGSWGGKDIEISKNKKRRFIMKFPKKMPRKDGNKGALIINEDGNAKVKEHLVSEVPFPFKTVKDFEASVRAPIGRSFVPETAFMKLTRPALVTKMGSIIEPMDEDILMKKKK